MKNVWDIFAVIEKLIDSLDLVGGITGEVIEDYAKN